MESLSRFFNRAKPFLAVISMQFGYAGMVILCKLALDHGMSHYALVVYRHAIATIVIAPFAFIFDRYLCFSSPLVSANFMLLNYLVTFINSE